MKPYWNRAVGKSADNSWNDFTKFTLFRIIHTIMNESCQFKKCVSVIRPLLVHPYNKTVILATVFSACSVPIYSVKQGISTPVRKNSKQDKETTVVLLSN